VTGKISTKSIACFFASYLNSSSTALKAGILGLLLVAASGFAIAADQKSNPNPCNVTEDEAAGLNRDLSTDVRAVHDYASTIAGMLKQEKFEQLDCLADHARSGKERFPGGTWKLHELYGGLYEPVQYPVHATQEDWNDLLAHLRHWRTARPKSITAPVALARAYLIYAHDARGSGYANTVSDSGWKLFGERTAEAKRILDEASTLPTKCPEWYVDMLLVAQNQNWNPARARALFEEAFKFEPGYYYDARVLAAYLLPKWSGQEGDTEKFLQETADRIGGDYGDILYFQVASANYVICGCDDNPHLSWERIEKGFEASEKRYGVSMLNLNRIAYLAAHFGKTDPILADKTLTRIGDQWDEETWEQKQDFDMVKKWAAYTAPFAVKLHVMEAAAESNMKSPDGPRYKASFEKTYRGLLQECVRTDGRSVDKWKGTFEVLASVGAKGTVEDNRIYSMGPVVICLNQKLLALHQEKATPFPPPPQAPYWVRLDLDWAEFAPVAAK
jgi:hypothetical protein